MRTAWFRNIILLPRGAKNILKNDMRCYMFPSFIWTTTSKWGCINLNFKPQDRLKIHLTINIFMMREISCSIDNFILIKILKNFKYIPSYNKLCLIISLPIQEVQDHNKKLLHLNMFSFSLPHRHFSNFQLSGME